MKELVVLILIIVMYSNGISNNIIHINSSTSNKPIFYSQNLFRILIDKDTSLKLNNSSKKLNSDKTVDTSNRNKLIDTSDIIQTYIKDNGIIECYGGSYYLADFTGGQEAIDFFISQNSNFILDSTNIGTYTCIVNFEIKTDGKIDNITLSESSGNRTFDLEVIRLISIMPKWKPAKDLNFKTINKYIRIPFTIENLPK